MVSRRIWYLCVLAGMIMLQCFTGNYALYILVIILILLPLISAVYGAVISKYLSVCFDEKKGSLVRGDRLDFRITLTSTAFLPVPYVHVHTVLRYNNSEELYDIVNVTDIQAKDRVVIENEVRANHAGELSVHCDSSYVYDPMLLFKFKIRHSDGISVPVMPVLVQPDFYAMYNSIEEIEDSREYSRNRKGNDSSQIFDVRGYMPGDALNRIHWKLSAKEDELCVKEFSQPVSSSNCILLELNEAASSDERCSLDGVYEMTYAIGNMACLKEKFFNLAYYSQAQNELRVIDIATIEELEEAIRIIIMEKAHPKNMGLKTFAVSELNGVEKIYYVTDIMDDELLQELEAIRGRINVYVVGAAANAGNIILPDNGSVCEVDRNDIFSGLVNTMM